MSSFYIHIPFCKQACHYCDFHFSTSFKKKEAMILALAKEIKLRKQEVTEPLQTIYFGGGTPSVLSQTEIDFLIDTVCKHYTLESNPEITLEANPDDLTADRIRQLASSGVNRLSIGVQSFFEQDLRMMHRAHNHIQAQRSIEEATRFFDNITIDLIYGIPGMSLKRWEENIRKALSFGIPHISSYALTVEPKTALQVLIQKGLADAPKEEQAEEHFLLLVSLLEQQGFVHYELSNFGKEGYFSVNNTSYWQGKKYIGIGPSAHSYDGISRSWNVANNSLYISNLNRDKRPCEVERLSVYDRYNEYVMTGLRTIWGISIEKIKDDFGLELYEYLIKEAEKNIISGLLETDGKKITVTQKGKFLSDGIASELFYVDKP